MKIRQIRRLRYRLVFAEANKIQTDTDLREWQNLKPVGREFGSPDYERLLKQDISKGVIFDFPSEALVQDILNQRRKSKNVLG